MNTASAIKALTLFFDSDSRDHDNCLPFEYSSATFLVQGRMAYTHIRGTGIRGTGDIHWDQSWR